MKFFFIAIINVYQAALSPETGFLPRFFGFSRPTCVFFPSCSAYAKESIRKHGAWKGALRGARRLLSCHPGATPRVWLPE